jgi:hypothetical protein
MKVREMHEALLLMKAAPDLLSVAKIAEQRLQWFADNSPDMGSAGKAVLREDLAIVRAAITKAEGSR